MNNPPVNNIFNQLLMTAPDAERVDRIAYLVSVHLDSGKVIGSHPEDDADFLDPHLISKYAQNKADIKNRILKDLKDNRVNPANLENFERKLEDQIDHFFKTLSLLVLFNNMSKDILDELDSLEDDITHNIAMYALESAARQGFSEEHRFVLETETPAPFDLGGKSDPSFEPHELFYKTLIEVVIQKLDANPFEPQSFKDADTAQIVSRIVEDLSDARDLTREECAREFTFICDEIELLKGKATKIIESSYNDEMDRVQALDTAIKSAANNIASAIDQYVHKEKPGPGSKLAGPSLS